MRRLATNSQRGFTLLEVLIASVLLASVFVAVISTMSRSLRNVDRLQTYEQVVLHAREKMTEILTRDALLAERTTGQWPDGYRWQVDVAPLDASPNARIAGYQLFRVRVQVLWGDPGRPRNYQLETVQWAGNADQRR